MSSVFPEMWPGNIVVFDGIFTCMAIDKTRHITIDSKDKTLINNTKHITRLIILNI